MERQGNLSNHFSLNDLEYLKEGNMLKGRVELPENVYRNRDLLGLYKVHIFAYNTLENSKN